MDPHAPPPANPTPPPAGGHDAVAGGPPPEPDLSGKVLGDFKVLRRLGHGGMGQVYLAEQVSLKRRVALKVLKRELALNETSLKRFRAEAEAVARATHPNIVQVYAVGEENGVHYMALEYVDGTNLRQYLTKKGVPGVPLTLSVMRQVAAALARAAELGIIHRDIKPENILLTRKGEVKVADFGLSRCFGGDGPQPLSLTQSGVTMGTPLYMSPEQVQGKAVDPRSDIYSFGVTCYHLLTGNPPFRGETPFEVAVQHVQAQASPLAAVRPDLPAELCAVVDRMMAKKPEDRFQTGKEIIRELGRVRDSLAGPGKAPATLLAIPAPTPRAVPTLPPRRPSWLLAAVPLSLVLALVAGAGVAWWSQPADALPDGASVDPAPREPVLPAEEQLLRREVEVTADPGKDSRRLEYGVRARLDLGLYLLEQERTADASAFFQELTDGPPGVKEYVSIGWLGKALVLAFEDRAKESNQQFLEFVRTLDRQPVKRFLLLANPRLRRMIARALDRNAVNCEAANEPFPAELERLRKPAPVTPAGQPKFPREGKAALKDVDSGAKERE